MVVDEQLAWLFMPIPTGRANSATFDALGTSERLGLIISFFWLNHHDQLLIEINLNDGVIESKDLSPVFPRRVRRKTNKKNMKRKSMVIGSPC
jgi:Tfp pilus assembly ATPase PilU